MTLRPTPATNESAGPFRKVVEVVDVTEGDNRRIFEKLECGHIGGYLYNGPSEEGMKDFPDWLRTATKNRVEFIRPRKRRRCWPCQYEANKEAQQ